MITVDFEKRGNQTLCDFLVSSIKDQILNNILKGNEKLPSKRSLAGHLGVSVITVQNAYAQLISEGYIYSEEKVGFFVTELKDSAVIKKSVSKKNPSAEKDYEIQSIGTEKNYVADFITNAASLEKFPFTEWSKLMRSVLNSDNTGLLRRQNVFGISELQKAISRYLSDFRNMKVQPSQIVIGAGTENLCSMLVQFLGREKIYGVENPGYQKTKQIFELNGACCVSVPIDFDGINLQVLNEKKVEVVHVSPSHHFPTGKIMPIKLRNQLISWAAENKDRYIIEDDYDSEFRFDGKPLPTLQSQDKNGKVIYFNTFSKTLSPSFRISYMVLPLELVELFNKRMGSYTCPVSSVDQYTLSKFINQGDFEKHLIRMKNYYRNLRNSLIKTLVQSNLSDKIEILEEGAGLHFLLKINCKSTYHQLKEKLRAAGINVALLSDYYSDNSVPSENAFIINYSGLQKEKILETVELMEKVVNN